MITRQSAINHMRTADMYELAGLSKNSMMQVLLAAQIRPRALIDATLFTISSGLILIIGVSTVPLRSYISGRTR
jgi:hypothetical protein